jgi:hypothetical protein
VRADEFKVADHGLDGFEIQIDVEGACLGSLDPDTKPVEFIVGR